MTFRKANLGVSLVLACGVSSAAMAGTVSITFEVSDTVTINSVAADLSAGESIDVSSSFETLDANPVDIIFLSDTTGSMGRLTDAAGAEADEIVERTATIGDVAWTVASYKDFPTRPWGGSSDYPFRFDQTITTDAGLAADGLRSWDAGGGADRRESNLFALNSIATNPELSFREDSDRYLLWFGDEPSHDPGDTPGYPGPTLDETIASLQAEAVTVLGVDLRNLNGDDELNQIVDQTGGSIGELDDSLSDLVYNSLLEVIDPRTDVTIDLELFAADGSSSLDFETSFLSLVRGSYELMVDMSGGFSLEAVDLAFDPDPGIAPIPLPATLPLLGFALGGFGLMSMRRRS